MGADEVGADFGGYLGGLLGDEEVGRSVGRQLPRGVVNFLPALAGGAIGALGGPVGAAAGFKTGLGLTAGLTGLDVFEKTGSPGRAAVAGGIAALTPPAIGGAVNAAGTKVLAQTGSKALAKLSTLPAGVAAGYGVDLAADVADIALAPERTMAEMATKEYWVGRTVANTALLPIDIQQAMFWKPQVAIDVEANKAVEQVVKEKNAEQIEREAFSGNTRQEVETSSRLFGIRNTIGNEVIPTPFLNARRKRIEAEQAKEVGIAPLEGDPQPLGFYKGDDTEVKDTFELYVEKVPRNTEEFVEQVDAINVMRQQFGEDPFVSQMLKAKTDEFIRNGDDAETALNKALQREKNKAQKLPEKRAKIQKVESATQLARTTLREITQKDPRVAKVEEMVNRRAAKYPEGYGFTTRPS